MKPYAGNRYPFCCALFAKADAPEALAVLDVLERRGIRSARRGASLIRRAGLVLLFLSPEAVRDKALLRNVSQAGAAGKTILTIFLRETELTPGLSMLLGQTQAILKYREESDDAFYEKLLGSPALRSLSVTPQQKRALRRRALFWAVSGVIVLGLGLLIGQNWRPIRARLPHSTLRQLGVPLDFDSVETLYVYGETALDEYTMPHYRLYADGEHDWVEQGDRLIPQGNIQTLDDFAYLRNLRELCICNDPIGSLEPILSLTQLTLLDISHDGLDLGGVDPAAREGETLDLTGIGALSRLEYLNVSYNHVDLGCLAPLTRLQTLNIAYTDLNDPGDLDVLLSLPSLQTVYIDAAMLNAAAALGETSFEIVCLDTPVYGYADLLSALNDPAVTDIRIMNGLTIPVSAQLTVRPEVALTGAGLDGNFTVNNYGTVHIYGVWEMGLCTRINYGTIVVEPGGLYTGGMCDTITTGTFRIEEGGRQNLERGATFSVSGGRYENNGDVYLQGGYKLWFLGGTVVNNGSLHLVPTEHGDLKIGVDRDKFVNNGKVYYNGVLVPNERLFSEEEK